MENVDEILRGYAGDLARHEAQIKTLFEQQKEIRELAKSTNNLAIAVEKLAEQYKSIGGRFDDVDDKFKAINERLEVIENDKRYKANIIWACVTTGIIGACITFVMTKVLG